MGKRAATCCKQVTAKKEYRSQPMAVPATLYTLVVLPFVAALLIAAFGGAQRWVHSGLAAAGSAIGLALILSVAGPVIGGDILSVSAPWVPAIGLDFSLMIDPLGLMFAGLIFGIGLLILAVGAGAVGDLAILLPFAGESLIGAEAFAGISETISSILPSVDSLL